MEMKYRAYNFITKDWAGWNSFEMGYQLKKHYTYYPHPKYQREGWKIMLFSGLKDKNDNNICESDIVEVDTTGMNYRNDKINGIVRFIDGCFTVEFLEPVYDNILKCMRERLYVKCFTVNKAIRIIGNIYDNPELLPMDIGEV
ncbi:hypothetical protein KAR91_59315 [Candidatus Pacearchaeota archaeon]|nr:hypothetical protein [Candidatus Pacearchaeota archaeon]